MAIAMVLESASNYSIAIASRSVNCYILNKQGKEFSCFSSQQAYALWCF